MLFIYALAQGIKKLTLLVFDYFLSLADGKGCYDEKKKNTGEEE